MANKIYLNNKDNDIPYEPSSSEDEYSEEEKEILREVRKGTEKKVDNKQELFAFDDNSEDEDSEDNDEDIIGDSDIERGDEDDEIPDAKAWGKQRRSYYNTDFVDQDYSGYNQQEEEQALQEEEEAKAIQLRLAKQLDEADFFLDFPTETKDSEDEDAQDKKSGQKTKLKSDLSAMTHRQKEQLFEKDSPEFAGLVNNFTSYFTESQSLLCPILNFASECQLSLPIVEFVRNRENLIMTYCTNIAFYLLLKAKRISIKNHPVTKRLVQLRKLLIQLQTKYDEVVKPQLEDLLNRINSGGDIQIDAAQAPIASKKKLRMLDAYTNEGDEEYGTDEEPPSKRVRFSDDEVEEGSINDEEDGVEANKGTERRGITYQIAKNKGLTPHRKKELRNPRVKHRGKYRKALIRRKGAVRTVRKELKRYDGEMSGIKATVKKGIKIKA